MGSAGQDPDLVTRAPGVADPQGGGVDVREPLAGALARIAPRQPGDAASHRESHVARVARRVRDPLLASDPGEVAIDLRGVDLAVSVPAVDPRDEPAVSGPRHGDAAHVAPGSRRELDLLGATARAIEMGHVDLAVGIVARGHPGDRDAVLRRPAGDEGDAADGDGAGREGCRRSALPALVVEGTHGEGRAAGAVPVVVAARWARKRRDHRGIAQASRGEILERLVRGDGLEAGQPGRIGRGWRRGGHGVWGASRPEIDREDGGRSLSGRGQGEAPLRHAAQAPSERRGRRSLADDQRLGLQGREPRVEAHEGGQNGAVARARDRGGPGRARMRRREESETRGGRGQLGDAARGDLDRSDRLRGEAVGGGDRRQVQDVEGVGARRGLFPRESRARGARGQRHERRASDGVHRGGRPGHVTGGIDPREHHLRVLAGAVGPRQQLPVGKRGDVDVTVHRRTRTDGHGVRAGTCLRVEPQPR